MPLNSEQQDRFFDAVDSVDIGPGDALDSASRQNPDAVAEALRLEKRVGVPADYIKNNVDEFRRIDVLQGINPQDLPKRSPVTSRWLENPRNASVAFDDIDVLEGIERNVRARDDRGLLDGLLDSMSVGFAKGYEASKLATARTQQAITDLLGGYSGGPGSTLSWTRERLQEEYGQEAERALSRIETADEIVSDLTPRNLSWWQSGVRSGVQSAAEMALPMGVTMATRGAVNPVMPFLSGKVFLDSYGTASVEGKTHLEALNYAQGQAAAEILTEMGPARILGDIAKDFGKGPLRDKLTRWFAQEFVGEQAATAIQTGIDVANALDEEMAKAETVEDVIKLQAYRQLVTGVATVTTGGLISGPLSGLNYLAGGRSEPAQQKATRAAFNRLDSSQAQDSLEDLITLAQSSKTNERAPEEFDEFIQMVDPEASVFLNADIAGELEGAPEYVTSQLDGTGADVVMSMRDFLRDFATDEEMLAFVRPHVKIREDLQTLADLEANVDSESVADLVKRAEKNRAVLTEAEQIYEEVKDRLIGTRRQGEATARLSAQLIPAYITAKHDELTRMGHEVTVRGLYEDMGLQVIGPDQSPEGMQGGEVLNQDETDRGDGTVGYKPQRINSLMQEFAYPGDPDKTKAAVAYIDPRDFIPTTTVEKSNQDMIRNEVDPLDTQELSDQEQTPFLSVERTDEGGWKIWGHEGRHRMQALADAGYTRVPVVMYTYQGQHGSNFEAITELEGQSRMGKTARPLKVSDVVPISYANLDRMEQTFGAGGLLLQEDTIAPDQDFGDEVFVRQVQDEAGNTVEIEERAQDVWDNLQQRKEMVERLRECLTS